MHAALRGWPPYDRYAISARDVSEGVLSDVVNNREQSEAIRSTMTWIRSFAMGFADGLQ